MKRFIFILFFPLFSSAQDCDILVSNGKIIDGTGNSWYYGSIAVKDGKIIRLARKLNLSAKRTMNAKGMIIAPGFTNVHTNLKGNENRNPMAKSLIYDGLTTCITGTGGPRMLISVNILNGSIR